MLTKISLYSLLCIIMVCQVKTKILENNIDLKSAIKEFCQGKSRNFCSKEHLKLLDLIIRTEKLKQEIEQREMMEKSKIILNKIKNSNFIKDIFSYIIL